MHTNYEDFYFMSIAFCEKKRFLLNLYLLLIPPLSNKRNPDMARSKLYAQSHVVTILLDSLCLTSIIRKKCGPQMGGNCYFKNVYNIQDKYCPYAKWQLFAFYRCAIKKHNIKLKILYRKKFTTDYEYSVFFKSRQTLEFLNFG